MMKIYKHERVTQTTNGLNVGTEVKLNTTEDTRATEYPDHSLEEIYIVSSISPAKITSGNVECVLLKDLSGRRKGIVKSADLVAV